MRFRREHRRPAVDLNMTPMIDCIFQLIIFFMLVQQFSRLELEEVSLPQASQARVMPEAPTRLVVNVRADGGYTVANEGMDLGRLAALLKSERDRFRAAGREQDLTVVVRADGAVPYERVQEVMAAAAALNIWRITFAALPEEGAETAGR